MVLIPGNMHVENVPDLYFETADRVRQYLQVRSAWFCDWHPDGESMLMATRFADTFQLHTLEQPGGARKQITFFREPISSGRFCGAPGEKGFLYSMDQGGGENFQIFYFDLENGQSKRLTDGLSKNGSPLWARGTTLFAFSSTLRNGRDHDIHLCDIKSPDNTRLVCQVQGLWVPLSWSPDSSQLLLLDYISANETYLHILDVASGEMRPLFPKTNTPVAYGDAYWSRDGKGIYFIADFDTEFQHLYYVDLESRAMTSLTAHIPWNVTEIDLSPDGKKLAVTTNEDGMSKLYLMDTETQKLENLEMGMGLIANARFSPNNQKLAFTFNRPNAPADIYTYEFEKGTITRWTESEVGGLNTQKFASPELIRYPSFDDMQIPAFYYRPQLNTDRPLPVLIHIHGGPESQFQPGFSSMFQYWINELDLAVIAPNVRGSTGYGKTYIKLDNGYLREDSVKDIGALLDWIAQQPELDEKRVCVMGGSYGGYMVLASLVHYSHRLRAGIDMVGISNFVTFLKNTKAYRRDLRRVEYGDERDPDMRSFLESISPTTNAHRIKVPLLVAQGLNDPRVPASEAEQIVKTVRENGQTVWYILAKDEGHGFQKQMNLEYYYTAVSAFLESHLLD
ncbi:peptidase S9, prolyl oligopeptidase [bacterium (Candidatus Blackallbacteria) CG17_big_fil_post_rev_8_21_14_2_50_48_46]|uniref:Peptidase S9, prolyl oligopeptidase n=1 Tax=bacterium (Candidatus Blackallbacteria) CG17_big_fil_post_rev_8_21_14_2_50_48_46 TaxID=2014261 RepID=A0A2M7G649_9BACT|nr:MAG: peptidase S9, prolyl oligopeptidase [bacterium (Candidatus Blackallbacteria) CG18_big_fil_WC_8_21_14_2_50_49_26]PIW17472.1 MAG: peptidase S9, prolyl oligopeptidase [bacterium (Candidatus Blackallbacteria) CG17_big_fil_post_rev_8_21_14_2_50_48_46]PIW48326.1 MAG: peptidase S9, prolyl oligopeptidase [bacterium (Candidatus Blackallbacteria) CG13_big_fil_rev_8_21_14_2_50_49_14]